MSANLNCPVCGSAMLSAPMRDHTRFRGNRVCPDCGRVLTVDASTKKRLWLLVAFAFTTLLLSARSFADGFPWSLMTVLSAIGLFVYLGYFLSKVRYVEVKPSGVSDAGQ